MFPPCSTRSDDIETKLLKDHTVVEIRTKGVKPKAIFLSFHDLFCTLKIVLSLFPLRHVYLNMLMKWP